eukprot:139676_1
MHSAKFVPFACAAMIMINQEDSQDEKADFLINDQHIMDRMQNQDKYEEILQKSINKVKIVIMLSMMVPFLGSTRVFVMELYVKSISNADTSIISTIIFASFIWFAIISFIVTSLGDKCGHDTMLLFAFLFTTIGVFVESSATTLYIFTIGLFIGRVAIRGLGIAYIAYILPHKYAIQYMSTLFTAASIVYLSGPLIAAFISDCTNYRNVFWINFIILCLCVIITIFFVIRSQNKLQKMQQTLSTGFINTQEYDDIFPVCIQNAKSIQNQGNDSSSWKSFFEDIGKYELIILSISLIQNSVVWTTEAILIFYYALFVQIRFKITDSLLYTSG